MPTTIHIVTQALTAVAEEGATAVVTASAPSPGGDGPTGPMGPSGPTTVEVAAGPPGSDPDPYQGRLWLDRQTGLLYEVDA